MNINSHLEKHNQHFSVTAFPKIVGNFLQEDTEWLQYKDNIDDLTEKLLLLDDVDFELSQNNKLVETMKAHASTSQEKWTANCLLKKNKLLSWTDTSENLTKAYNLWYSIDLLGPWNTVWQLVHNSKNLRKENNAISVWYLLIV